MVPSYNHERFVRRCLLSIIGQSHRTLELIVIDDGSQDDSVRKIEAELKDCPFSCRLIVRPHKGVAATLKEGLKPGSGEYFAYLRSDDVWLPGFLESRVRVLESRELAVLAYGHSFVINEEDQWPNKAEAPGNEVVKVQRIRVRARDGITSESTNTQSPVGIELAYSASTRSITDPKGRYI